jgi:hypothetical protein
MATETTMKAKVEKALGEKVVAIPALLKLQAMKLVELNALASKVAAHTGAKLEKPFDGKNAAIDFLQGIAKGKK